MWPTTKTSLPSKPRVIKNEINLALFRLKNEQQKVKPDIKDNSF